MAAAEARDGTVGKALEVLDLVASFARPVRFAEIERRATFPKATLYRLIQTLTNQGMLSFDPDHGTYALGVRLVRLAHAAWAQSSLAPIARPYLDDLSRALGKTVHLAQLDDGQVLYVDKRNAAVPIEMFSQAGKVGPAYCTGVGKAMLAFLDEPALASALQRQSFHRFTPHSLCTAEDLRAELGRIRARGYAFDREEHEPGIICVAVPVLSTGGRVLGGLSVTTSTDLNSLDDLERLVPSLQRTARCIAGEAESWRFPETERELERTEAG